MWVYIPVCRCSPVSAAWTLRPDESGYELSPMSNGTDMHKGSSCLGCGMERLTQPPSIPMSQSWMEDYFKALISPSADFRANPTPRPESDGGGADERNLWPDTMRILRECGAWGFVGENVPGIVSNGFAAQVLADLEREGFCGTPFSNSACAVGFPHPRERVFFVAHSVSKRRPKASLQTRVNPKGRQVAQGTRGSDGIVSVADGSGKIWCLPDSATSGAFDGMEYFVDRLRCCGNGVLPDEAVPAFEKLIAWANR